MSILSSWPTARSGYRHTAVESAIKFIFRNQSLHVDYIDDAEAKPALERERVAFLNWNYGTRTLDIADHKPNMADASFIVVNGAAPVWQLEQGWYNPEGDHRWIATEATARLARPAGALAL